jgi:FAD:protein FMN transferase
MIPKSIMPSRRRVLKVSAALAGIAATGAVSPVRTSFQRSKPGGLQIFEWKGQALGAQTSLQLVHENRDEAVRVLASCREEIERLEDIFSLYRPTSEISRLNRDAVLLHPSLEFKECLEDALLVSQITEGAFDVTVGPLWHALARHFSHARSATLLSKEVLEKAREKIGFEKVNVSSGQIRLEEPGMSLTLNGIAQGYITDRVAELLERRGFTNVLVSLGELRALDGPEGNQGWKTEITSPEGPLAALSFDLHDRALATSAGAGLEFDAAGVFNHLIDPQTGTSNAQWVQTTISAKSAARADALSTGLMFLQKEKWANVLGEAQADFGLGWSKDDGHLHKVFAPGSVRMNLN